ncbi:hypothetical protein V5799_027597 [Amblyomma americanum]|uniref:Uncharacterized protein n=1 Tax=Amblyomma americanum TaxID=6943 RepID=A0AAQ4DF97_AMBAM
MDPVLHAVIIGDSEVKCLNRTRLYVPANMCIRTFSYGGADAGRLLDIIKRMLLKPLHFVGIYVGGNDLWTERSPENVADDIKLSETEAQKKKRRRLDAFIVKSLAASEDVVLVGVQGRFVAGERQNVPCTQQMATTSPEAAA